MDVARRRRTPARYKEKLFDFYQANHVSAVGIDGMDPNFLERHWSSLPHLAELAQKGEFKRLETTMPPQSPVAWSTFITGTDPGAHGIFDFVHRDPKTLAPYSSMAQTAEGARTISMGDYELPITSGKVANFRQGKPFWQMLADNHVAVNVNGVKIGNLQIAIKDQSDERTVATTEVDQTKAPNLHQKVECVIKPPSEKPSDYRVLRIILRNAAFQEIAAYSVR